MGVVAVSSVLVSCASAPRRIVPRHYDASNPLKRVAVLPLKNDTLDVAGPDLVRKKMIEMLESRAYIVKDVQETDQILRDRMGITLGGQLEMTTPQKLGEALGVEGVLYGSLMDFDETTTGLINVRKVRAKFKLVDTGAGQTFWERGLGVRTETKMAGRSGSVTSALNRTADAREKEVPWVTIDSVTTSENNIGKAFALGMGAKLLTKAIGVHLDYESKEMARRIIDTLPWGPGPETASAREPVAKPMVISLPKIKNPQAPSFGYMDYGKKDFSAVLISVTMDKNSSNSYNYEIPISKAGEKIRMDMDLSTMMKGGQGAPPAMSRMSMVYNGDKNTGYTLYPESKKFMTITDGKTEAYEKPLVEKTRIGSEVVDKHPTDKYKVKITYKNGTVQEGFMWYARDLDNMTIKSELENSDVRVTTELKTIVLKTPPGSLFEIPGGYTEAHSFMELMAETK